MTVAVAVLALYGAALGPSQAPANADGFSPATAALWERTIAPRLAGEPWTGPGRYDAAHVLMVPLHAAFQQRFEPGQRMFADHAARFLAGRGDVHLAPEAQLSWLQYFYLLSRFLVLTAEHRREDLVPAALPDALYAWTVELWTRAPAAQWRRAPFRGIGERLRWKLADTSSSGRSYDRAVVDSERFLFAVAADLRRYGRQAGSPLADDPLLREIGDLALRAHRARVVWGTEGGWTFQPGVWRDHPDHRFACRVEKQADLRPCPVPDVAEDASHSHRWPLWLRSLAGAHLPGSSERDYYERLLRGLERQFHDHVVVPPSAEFTGWRLHNYMDGRNGIYRWNYRTLARDEGYGPYELSGALLHGWWGFLPGERTRRVYTDLVGRFPLTREELVVYGGPRPAGRPRDPAVGILADGTAELLCRLSAGLR